MTLLETKINKLEQELNRILKTTSVRSVEFSDTIPLNRFQLPGVQVLLNSTQENERLSTHNKKSWILNYDVSVMVGNIENNANYKDARKTVHEVYNVIQQQRESGRRLNNEALDIDVTSIEYGVLGLGIEKMQYIQGGIIRLQLLINEQR